MDVTVYIKIIHDIFVLGEIILILIIIRLSNARIIAFLLKMVSYTDLSGVLNIISEWISKLLKICKSLIEKWQTGWKRHCFRSFLQKATRISRNSETKGLIVFCLHSWGSFLRYISSFLPWVSFSGGDFCHLVTSQVILQQSDSSMNLRHFLALNFIFDSSHMSQESCLISVTPSIILYSFFSASYKPNWYIHAY